MGGDMWIFGFGIQLLLKEPTTPECNLQPASDLSVSVVTDWSLWGSNFCFHRPLYNLKNNNFCLAETNEICTQVNATCIDI